MQCHVSQYLSELSPEVGQPKDRKGRVKTAVTATVEKTWPKNGHFRNGDYFAISTSCLHSILFTNYPKNGFGGSGVE